MFAGLQLCNASFLHDEFDTLHVVLHLKYSCGQKEFIVRLMKTLTI